MMPLESEMSPVCSNWLQNPVRSLYIGSNVRVKASRVVKSSQREWENDK